MLLPEDTCQGSMRTPRLRISIKVAAVSSLLAPFCPVMRLPQRTANGRWSAFPRLNTAPIWRHGTQLSEVCCIFDCTKQTTWPVAALSLQGMQKAGFAVGTALQPVTS